MISKPLFPLTNISSLHRVCTVIGDEWSAWNSSHLILSPGHYVLVWDALLISAKSSRVYIDNITLLAGNCTADHTPGET